MVELRLPKNSRISPDGVVWDKKKSSAKKLRKFNIYRYNPDDQSNPRVDTYYIDSNDSGPMVLDALIYIKEEIVLLNPLESLKNTKFVFKIPKDLKNDPILLEKNSVDF